MKYGGFEGLLAVSTPEEFAVLHEERLYEQDIALGGIYIMALQLQNTKAPPQNRPFIAAYTMVHVADCDHATYRDILPDLAATRYVTDADLRPSKQHQHWNVKNGIWLPVFGMPEFPAPPDAAHPDPARYVAPRAYVRPYDDMLDLPEDMRVMY